MASALAEVTVYIDSNDPVYAARFQELLGGAQFLLAELEWYATASDYELANDGGQRARQAVAKMRENHPPDNGVTESANE